jgi:multidrug efflux pump subunit AcrA (membrane-fusion protein)
MRGVSSSCATGALTATARMREGMPATHSIQHTDLSFGIGGRVTGVLVKEGDMVRAGRPLVRLEDADLKAALAQI